MLAIFLGCALVPTLIIGTVSYRSVRGQLTDQADAAPDQQAVGASDER